ncbi:protein FAR1-RELATED SEQUENCE 5-like [Mercurialis annua]|uniref:protein FAR1-RELATED SEQUENCE 5-like n=1 Tax=Mercurialis annua TaxID=3986 RepID=UPI0021609C8D|nr:protein FAR1-RELATED SEQUENCE 5-like [Mercurialis annua]
MADKRQATYDLVGNFIKDKYSNFKTVYTPADIIRDMKKEYGVELSYQTAWRSKERGLELTRGHPADSYKLLPSYLHALKTTNPGSVAELETREDRFLYVFISLNASIKGWGFCKPIIVVDATQDAANKIFPLAFCVVDSENDASWEWFFNKLRETFGVREGMCIISDRHDSIKKAIENVFPEAHHGICTYYLFNNVKARYRRAKGEIREQFFGAAKAYTIEQFEKHMAELDKFDPKIREYLTEVGFKKWTTVHSTSNRYSTMTSNIAESLNATNIAARELPITTMLEFLRSLVQKWTHANRNCARSLKTDMTKVAEDILNESYIRSLNLTVSPANDNIYTVTKTKTPFSVNLDTQTCCCRRFQTHKIPCAHAVAVIRKYNKDPLFYCSKYYMKETYVNTYIHTVYPMTNKSTWNTPQEVKDIIVLPPESRTKSGRPKKKRIVAGHEKRSKNTCTVCKKKGYNKKTCKRSL